MYCLSFQPYLNSLSPIFNGDNIPFKPKFVLSGHLAFGSEGLETGNDLKIKDKIAQSPVVNNVSKQQIFTQKFTFIPFI
jgi:hypothetical protein